MAAHLGEVDEERVNNMAYVWFQLILEALGKKLNYESISNLWGNSFAKDAAKVITAANPLRASDRGTGGSGAAFAQMAGSITILDNKTGDDLFAGSDSPLGDIGWIKQVGGGGAAKKE